MSALMGCVVVIVVMCEREGGRENGRGKKAGKAGAQRGSTNIKTGREGRM